MKKTKEKKKKKNKIEHRPRNPSGLSSIGVKSVVTLKHSEVNEPGHIEVSPGVETCRTTEEASLR